MADRIDHALGVLAFAIAATGFFGWQSLRRANAAAPGATQTPVASPELQQLIPFATVLADSQLAVRTSVDSAPLRHDPFAADAPARVAVEPHEGASAHTRNAADSTGWRVSATLISSARRAAIINDVLTYVGDRVPGGGKLVAVESDRVVLTDSKGASHTVMADKEGT